MAQIRRYLPLILIVFFAVVVTGLAMYSHGSDTINLTGKDTWGIPYWLTPLGYLGLALLFKGGFDHMNQPLYAVLAFFVYGLAAIALFITVPMGFQWHFIIGASALAYVFFG